MAVELRISEEASRGNRASPRVGGHEQRHSLHTRCRSKLETVSCQALALTFPSANKAPSNSKTQPRKMKNDPKAHNPTCNKEYRHSA